MKKRILWIDDEMYKIRDLADGLREEGISVIEAVTESEWIKQLNKRDGFFKLVVLDIMLPKGNGQEEKNTHASLEK